MNKTYYDYDVMNRLASATPQVEGPLLPLPAQAGGTYSYDWVGNMKAKAASNPWTYNAADQLSLWPGMHSYSYDDNGALTAVKTPDGQTEQQTFTYHPTGLMNTALFNNQTQTLTNLWDADEHRVGFSVGEDEYTAVFDVTAGIPAVVAEKQPDNSYVYYVREPGGELICRVVMVGETMHKWFYHFDELGSTRLITDDASPAVVTDRYTYDAYGTMIAHDRNTGTIDQPYQFVGQLGYYTHWMAPEFGWLQLGVRFYDPETGRFERRDPLPSFAVSPYSYAAASPSRYVDPSGRVVAWVPVGLLVAYLGWGATCANHATALAVPLRDAGFHCRAHCQMMCSFKKCFLGGLLGSLQGLITDQLILAMGLLLEMAQGWDWFDLRIGGPPGFYNPDLLDNMFWNTAGLACGYASGSCESCCSSFCCTFWPGR